MSLDLRISNPRGAAADLTASVFCDGRLLDRTRITASPGQSSHRLAFDYDLEGLRFLSVQVTEGRGKGAVMRTPAVAAYIKPHRETLAKFERMARQAKPRSAEASHERAALLAAISDLRERAAAAFGSESRWKALGAGIEEVEKSLGRLRARCADTASIWGFRPGNTGSSTAWGSRLSRRSQAGRRLAILSAMSRQSLNCRRSLSLIPI